jgi:hypothetical protein
LLASPVSKSIIATDRNHEFPRDIIVAAESDGSGKTTVPLQDIRGADP